MLGFTLAQCLGMLPLVASTILMNGQEKVTNYPDTKIDIAESSFKTYQANATEISYQGRWDSNHVSWWSAPGLRLGFTGQTLAITFGNSTSSGVLVGYRIGGLDWNFTNATAGGTHLLVTPSTPGANETWPFDPLTFELRVTNWAYGVQIAAVHVAAGEKLVRLPSLGRRIEVIGDSLAAGMYTSYEGLSSWAYALGAGLGDTEYSVTAYPGICAADQDCWGNPRGQAHQWFYTSDTSGRAVAMYGDDPEPWDFKKNPAADIVVINIGTNDQNAANNVSTATYIDALTKIIEGVHGKWPKAQVIVMVGHTDSPPLIRSHILKFTAAKSLWLGFYQSGNSYFPSASQGFEKEIYAMYQYFNSDAYLANPVIWDGTTNKTTSSTACGSNKTAAPFVHYFNTTGILQHNDIGPQYHPTDVGAVKIASHLIQYIKIKFGWELRATGPEVLHDTLYWNDQQYY
ncbi:Lipase, GDSL-like protein [Coniochaeta ligniaria NRRL 30616]|uniref:Lipase, GDSL-like protein n=1 Tax=Coniochaeta ligniaria NRRL 30616 TaxID=1408157 RepID=A0A1J7JNM6_9PEZI|nr:Lipase, GDSL-like protein [Coniochaeta ligniaria NRRL 30616]